MLLLLSDGESDSVTRIGSFELFILNNHDSQIILRPDTITPSRGIFKRHIKVIIYIEAQIAIYCNVCTAVRFSLMCPSSICCNHDVAHKTVI